MKFYVLKVSVLILVCFLSTSCTKDSVDTDPVDELQNELKEGEYSSLENEILVLLNEFRISQGMKSLKRAEIVSSISNNHTLYMINSDKISHDNFLDRHSTLVSKVNATQVGENVAFGYNSARGVVSGWLASDSHRTIIETTSFTHFGIAVSADSAGRNYFTNIFIER